MHRGTRTLFLVFITLGLLAIVGGTAAAVYVWRWRNATSDITVNNVNIAEMKDGKYYGKYKVFHAASEVEVSVRDGKIIDIYLLEGTSNKDKMESVSEQVIDEQSLDVDTITGATVSQKVALKAIENALEGKPQ
ncbi:MAG: FMN-binding protein [Actinobacteria bacterium]|nr:FMN-binding protein [Actinomycetota bacterium]